MTVPAEWEDWRGDTWVAVTDERQTVWIALGPSRGRPPRGDPPDDPPDDGTEIGATEVVFADGATRTARIVDRLVAGRALRSLEVSLPDKERMISATTPVQFAEPCRALIAQMFSTIALKAN